MTKEDRKYLDKLVVELNEMSIRLDQSHKDGKIITSTLFMSGLVKRIGNIVKVVARSVPDTE